MAKTLKKICVVFWIILLCSCAGTKVSQFKRGPLTHPVNTIGIRSFESVLGGALGSELRARGFKVVKTEDERNTSKIDAYLSAQGVMGYDTSPQNVTVTLKSAKTGETISGVNWENARGGAPASPADRIMRKSAVEAAKEIVELLMKDIPVEAK